MSVALFDEASPRDALITTNSTSAKICHFGKHAHLQAITHISQLVVHPCKNWPLSHKSLAVHLHKSLQSPLSKLSLHPGSSEEVSDHPAELLSPSTSQSPLSSSALTPFLTLKTFSPHAKTSTIPLPKPLPSPLEAAPSIQPGIHLAHTLPYTAGLLFEHQPFIVTWNIPDVVCNRYNISLDTSPFKAVATPAKVPGQFLTLFYTDKLGLYPYVDIKSQKQFYGGIPQRANLKASMDKAREDINYYIPSKGLAVIDWEEWRPLWDRNWGNKRIYQTLSVAHVMQRNSSLTAQQATRKAKQEFQAATREFMSGMLQTGKAMRPNYLWGFYLFPSCYNYGWLEPNYTGQCTKEVKRQNNELLWLWKSSTALYPSVYLQVSLADNPKAALMVRNRVQEALRVSALPRLSNPAPVFVYMRPVFVDQNRRFLSQGDLISTIGESAAVGASGAVLWGASVDYDDQTSCEALSSYLTSVLNPYVTNVTAAAQLCSNFLCRGNGRCVRKKSRSSYYLHLNPENFRVLRVQERYFVLGRPTLADLKTLGMRFKCQCYKGLSCTPRTYRELAKMMKFSMKQGMNQKSYSLTKLMLDNKQQVSINKDNVKERK
ncbi:hyaluronidase PH-20-like [Melanotaenia boesemani]|uniref:hyaluronidase PH-20-like n=1 Tax=Melanotaenia boesemani TaxID=1250792 RepID=UPI001C04AD21|nr:hyaluronidase PH-20-like [Melanotaenia boesemani]